MSLEKIEGKEKGTVEDEMVQLMFYEFERSLR